MADRETSGRGSATTTAGGAAPKTARAAPAKAERAAPARTEGAAPPRAERAAPPRAARKPSGARADAQELETLNEVHLLGRVSGMPTTRVLPSGDELIAFRLVVTRAGTQPAGAPSVDTLDIACWTGRARQRARVLVDGDRVRVSGSLRRRFFRQGGAPSSRYEVAAESVSRVR